jgi:hypothetical protein
MQSTVHNSNTNTHQKHVVDTTKLEWVGIADVLCTAVLLDLVQFQRLSKKGCSFLNLFARRQKAGGFGHKVTTTDTTTDDGITKSGEQHYIIGEL